MNVNITFGFLCFNTKEISLECFRALLAEAKRLYPLVRRLCLVVVDNGSDGTGQECINLIEKEYPSFDHVELVVEGNMGQGAARNRIEQTWPSDYILFVDGDIQIVPGSAYLMLLHMMTRPRLGCLSPHPAFQVRVPEKATQEIKAIGPIKNDVRSACTGYAMFNANTFKSGLKFEEGGPFYGPGWGLEDDDMWLQMTQAGWAVDFFLGITYLQRQQRSSWPSLKAQGYDVVQIFEARKEFFLEKWRTKGVDPAILLNVKGQNLRGLDA